MSNVVNQCFSLLIANVTCSSAHSARLTSVRLVLQNYRRLTQLTLVGDPKQLQATVLSQRAAACGMKRSLMERLMLLNHDVVLLDEQYRCAAL